MTHLTWISVDNNIYIVRKLCSFTFVGCKNNKCKYSHHFNNVIIKCKPSKCIGKHCKYYHTGETYNISFRIFRYLFNILFECSINIPFMNITVNKNYIYKFNPKSIDDILNLYVKFNYVPIQEYSYVDKCLEIPKLKRCNREVYNESILNTERILSLNKLKIDESVSNEIEYTGASDEADVSLYSTSQQFKWFFMNNKQKTQMLNQELDEYKFSKTH